MPARDCDGCLGTGRCWICAGEGCSRCDSSGRCHLCGAEPARVIRLVEPPAAPAEVPGEAPSQG